MRKVARSTFALLSGPLGEGVLPAGVAIPLRERGEHPVDLAI
jgi:hypothetical protein